MRTVLEGFPLFLDLLEMDPFMLKKARPAGMANGPLYQGTFYPESGIDPTWSHFSDTLLINLNGEFIERTVPSNAALKEKKFWFKKTTGHRRRLLYLKHLQNLILLNLIETSVHGYSTRDGADLAIKLTVITTELDRILNSNPPNYFAFRVSLAEAQPRRFERPDGMRACLDLYLLLDLMWLLAMKQLVTVSEVESLSNWDSIQNDVECLWELLRRYIYWIPVRTEGFKV